MNHHATQQPTQAWDDSRELYRVDVLTELTALAQLAPRVVDLVDTRQRGLGFLTPDAKTAIARQVAADRRAHAQRLKAGQVVGPGESPAPGNLNGLSVHAELWATLRHQVRRVVRALANTGVCTTHTLPTAPDTGDLIGHLTALVTDHDLDADTLLELLDDLVAAHDAADRLLDGNDRTLVGDCPHCGQRSLVAYFRDDQIRCDRNERHRQPCICNAPVCDCKRNPSSHEHTWYRTRTGSEGWYGLADRLSTTRAGGGAR